MIYFIQDTGSGTIKIGISKKPANRLATLQVASASKLILLAVMDGDKDTEQALHREFRHVNGEWFAPNASLLGYIRKHGTRVHIEVPALLTKQARPRRSVWSVLMRRLHRPQKRLAPKQPEKNEDFNRFIDAFTQYGPMSEEQAVEVMALMKRADGRYICTADEIAGYIYGKRADVATKNVVRVRVAAVRPA